MSRQLTISTAISILMMAAFVALGPVKVGAQLGQPQPITAHIGG